jgi:hypothetical protein
MDNYIINKQINANLDYIEDFDIWDIKTIFNYIISRPIQFVLLLLVFIIIYFVDYISQINSAIYGVTQSIPIPGQQQHTQPKQLLPQKKKKGTK